MIRKMGAALVLAGLIYLALGLAFHIKWKAELRACREARRAQGAFVEPEVFPVLGVFFDMTAWPVYAWANIYHHGTPFATPCTHSEARVDAPHAAARTVIPPSPYRTACNPRPGR
ncbi:MAG: hypothetical protein GXO37_04395 [Chloroflexi bacterium]|nr:hypothetical protein [Chloroflexota bacterium]